MAHVLAERVKETTTTTGTGTINLAGASTGFRSFVAAVGDGNTCDYVINDGAGNWEAGIGTVTDGTPDTLSRDTVIENSLGTTAKINFGSGTKDVYLSPLHIHFGASHAPFGLKLTNGSDADHDVNIAAGCVRDITGLYPLVLGSSITIAIDASGALGLSTGSVAANTLYGVWLWGKTGDRQAITATFDPVHDARGAPTEPSGYDIKRLIGFVVTNASSNIIGFRQQGDYFRFTGATIQDINDASIANQTFEVGTLSVPGNCLAHIYGAALNTTSSDAFGTLWIKTNGAGEAASFGEDFMDMEAGGITFDSMSKEGFVMVDGSRQIQYATRESSGSATALVRTLGCLMLTRSNP